MDETLKAADLRTLTKAEANGLLPKIEEHVNDHIEKILGGRLTAIEKAVKALQDETEGAEVVLSDKSVEEIKAGFAAEIEKLAKDSAGKGIEAALAAASGDPESVLGKVRSDLDAANVAIECQKTELAAARNQIRHKGLVLGTCNRIGDWAVNRDTSPIANVAVTTTLKVVVVAAATTGAWYGFKALVGRGAFVPG